MLYKGIEEPQNGDRILFRGIYALHWPWESGVEPTIAFVEAEQAVCPDCKEVMVKAHMQSEDGDWRVCWLCKCEPDPQIVASNREMA